ncbi:3-mercaptopyruvate sulfurtransferase [Halomonas sp. HP20-15]|uniref:3-mercaptopyruvate sulfurtransferase n=1 Tax=Halomonas sp. HP20-15 TaxID=3085901 RepID=UPI00298138F7|nr:3-mercaptopyruvate sulfurtransferase [Halomonas sp. HP20-15]MDW5375760.1 3-mercaptopyruvate sulfurtransferase [Halomonas sp. HP20-15]
MALSNLVTVDWLQSNLDLPEIVILDASWYLPTQSRDPDAEYLEGHIPGAKRFDFDGEIKDASSSLPHMLPAASEFTAAVRALGVNADSRVVVYDGMGVFAAPRAWWMFKVMGHGNVAVLDGGLPAWKAAGLALESGPPAAVASSGNFEARLVSERLADAAEVAEHLEKRTAQVVDARSPARFSGEQPEPRPGLRAGHMPGAMNLPFDRLLEDGFYRSPEVLEQRFREAGIESGAPVVGSCGSGVTASVLALGAELAGLGPMAVYDGSWAEWGQESRPELAVVKGGVEHGAT